jgi:PAS domain S-box-containing protein
MIRSDPSWQQAEQLYRAVLSNISDAVFIVRDDGRFTFVCPNAHVIFGYGEQEVIAMDRIDRLLPMPLYDPVQLEREGEITNIERTIKDKRGRRHVLLINAKRVSIGEGTVLVTCRDITRRKQDELLLVKYQSQLRRLASELSDAEERERRRIATALHDVIGQRLVATMMKLGGLREYVVDHPTAQDLMEQAIASLEQTIRDSRQLTFELSPPVLYELGLVPALEWLTEQFEQRDQLHITFEHHGPMQRIPDAAQVVLFRTARELLINVRRHAGVDRATLSLVMDDECVALGVQDEGRGFDVAAKDHRHKAGDGFGLFSIRERIHHMGGRFDLNSRPGEGTQVRVVLPHRLDETLHDEDDHEHTGSAG